MIFLPLEIIQILPLNHWIKKMKNTCKSILIIGTAGSGLTAAAIEAMSKQFPLSITAEAVGQTANFRVTGALYDWNNTAEDMTAQVDQFLADGVLDVHVYLNGPGGDVFLAAEIENQILRFPGKKIGTGGALIASAYTKIASCLDDFKQADNGHYMYHKPSANIRGNEDEVTSGLQLLKNLSTSYKETYATKTGLSVEQIESNWSKGDVWLTAKEAAAQKFISGVIKKEPITAEIKALFQACHSPIIPKITNIKKPVNIMNQKLLAQALGLPEDASEEQINAVVLANKKAAEETAGLKATATLKEESEKTVKVDALINGAITDKKITAAQAEPLKSWAKLDFMACENHIKALTALGKVSDAIVPGATSTTAKDYSAMTEAEQQTLAQEDPEAFRASYMAYLEKK